MQTAVNINQWGNSKAIRLRSEILESAGLMNAQKLNVEVSDGKIVLTLAEQEDDGSLSYLFRDYVDDGIREPIIDFGESMGNELW